MKHAHTHSPSPSPSVFLDQSPDEGDCEDTVDLDDALADVEYWTRRRDVLRIRLAVSPGNEGLAGHLDATDDQLAEALERYRAVVARTGRTGRTSH